MILFSISPSPSPPLSPLAAGEEAIGAGVLIVGEGKGGGERGTERVKDEMNEKEK